MTEVTVSSIQWEPEEQFLTTLDSVRAMKNTPEYIDGPKSIRAEKFLKSAITDIRRQKGNPSKMDVASAGIQYGYNWWYKRYGEDVLEGMHSNRDDIRKLPDWLSNNFVDQTIDWSHSRSKAKYMNITEPADLGGRIDDLSDVLNIDSDGLRRHFIAVMVADITEELPGLIQNEHALKYKQALTDITKARSTVLDVIADSFSERVAERERSDRYRTDLLKQVVWEKIDTENGASEREILMEAQAQGLNRPETKELLSKLLANQELRLTDSGNYAWVR